MSLGLKELREFCGDVMSHENQEFHSVLDGLVNVNIQEEGKVKKK